MITKDLQNSLLAMYADIKAVCDRQGISLLLLGGSALGAVRHKGFIPWDDDLDVGMLREDFIIFSAIFEKELGDQYLLNAPSCSKEAKNRFPKIIKKGTTFKEAIDVSNSELTGVFIDIFILENVPQNPLVRYVKGVFCNGAEFVSGQVYLYENCNDIVRSLYKKTGKSAFRIRMAVGMIFSFMPASKWFELIDKCVQYQVCGNCLALPTGRKHYFGEILPYEVFFPTAESIFEGMTVTLPGQVDVYLENLYGDYMTMPPEEKRERHFVIELKC